MARRVYSEIGRFKKVKASLRGVSAALLASRREVEAAMAGSRTEPELAVLRAAGERIDVLLSSTREAQRQFWFEAEELG